MSSLNSANITISGLGVFAALLLVLLLPLLWRYRRRLPRPFMYYSQLADLPTEGVPNRRQRLIRLGEWLYFVSLAFFAVALTDLTLLLPPLPPAAGTASEHTPTEGTALYFVLDMSGSMAHQVPYEGGGDLPPIVSKVALAKFVTEHFIAGDPQLGLSGRPDDLIGLVAFARKADILAPLTLDHDAVIDKIRNLQVVGSQDDDGTGIGYAIYKTASTIAATRHYGEQLPSNQKPAYSILSNAIILITDGFQSPNELDKGNWLRTMEMEDAAEYAKEQGIKLYLVNIEPSLAKPEFAPHRHLLQRVAETTGGKFFLVDNLDQLPAVYREIDSLEKNILPIMDNDDADHTFRHQQPYRRLPLYPALIVCGMLSLAAAILLETRSIRMVP